jgi:hypothetical protein
LEIVEVNVCAVPITAALWDGVEAVRSGWLDDGAVTVTVAFFVELVPAAFEQARV